MAGGSSEALSRRAFLSAVAAAPAAAQVGVEAGWLIEARRIWEAAPHNAFTDLVWYKGRFHCAFREGSGHVSPDGALRLLSSADGRMWDPAALVKMEGADLRDPKLTVTPDNRLMLTSAAAYPAGSAVRHRSYAWFSAEGRDWTQAFEIGEPNMWLWRVTWHRGTAYSVGYPTAGEDRFVRLYGSRDGLDFRPVVDRLFERGYANESSIAFLPGETAVCLLRRDGEEPSAQLGTSRAPYRGWTWRDLGVRVGGPHILPLADGRIVAGVRLYDGKVRTSLAWLDAEEGRLEEFLALPSGGDTSYPGLVFRDGVLWVSYYSSHEAKTSIYLAKVRLPAAPRSAD